MSNEPNRACGRCKGEDITIRRAFTYTPNDGGRSTSYPEERSTCDECQGAKTIPGIDVSLLLKDITTTRGSKTGKGVFRKSAPKHWGAGATLVDRRAYCVWRLARFHGGADVCLPMTADMLSRNDPFKQELDLLADAVAKRVYGSNMAAAYRWGRLLGNGGATPPGQPAAAYESGPVADEGKPDWELLELR